MNELTKPKTASLIRFEMPTHTTPDRFYGRCFWRLSEPVLYDMDYDTDRYTKSTSYIITSAVNVMGTDECYAFPANADGEIVDWGELPGSSAGTINHALIIERLGYAPMTNGLTTVVKLCL